MAKKWLITARTTKTGQNPPSDTYAFYGPCFEDDFYLFRANNNLQFDNGAQKCHSYELQTATGTWKVNSAAKTLDMRHSSISGDNSQVSRGGTIEQLTADKLIIVRTDTLANKTTLVITRSTYQGQTL